MFTYIPKKSKEIYSKKIAHRGFHLNYPENTIPAYVEALKLDYAIELDIRITKDNQIICLHDRHTKRLLGIEGKTSNMTLKKINEYYVQKSNYKVPTLKEVLNIINSKTILLIEVKGYLTQKFKEKLENELYNYDGIIYFHAKNIFTYLKLRKTWKDKVFWILNPFRKRFNFIKKKHYNCISLKIKKHVNLTNS